MSKKHENQARMRRERREAGNCVDCGKPRGSDGTTQRCREHADRTAEVQQIRRDRQRGKGMNEDVKQEINALAEARYGRGVKLRERRDAQGLVYWLADPSNQQVFATRWLPSLLAHLRTKTKTQERKERRAAMMNSEATSSSSGKEPMLVTADVISRATGFSETSVHRFSTAGLYGHSLKGRLKLYDKEKVIAALQAHAEKGGQFAPRPRANHQRKMLNRMAPTPKGGRPMSPSFREVSVRGADVPADLKGRIMRAMERLNRGPAKVTYSGLVVWCIEQGLDQLEND